MTDAYYPSFDGVVNVVENYMRYLGRDNDCVLIAPKYPEKRNYVEKDEFKVVRCKSLIGTEGYRMAIPRLDRKLGKFLKEEKFDIIHVHSPFLLGRYMVDYGKKAGIPTVCTLHTKYKWDLERSLNNSKPLIAIAMNYIIYMNIL